MYMVGSRDFENEVVVDPRRIPEPAMMVEIPEAEIMDPWRIYMPATGEIVG